MIRDWLSSWVSTRRSMATGENSSARSMKLKKSPRPTFAASPTRRSARKTAPSPPWKLKRRNQSQPNQPKESRNEQGETFALHDCRFDSERLGIERLRTQLGCPKTQTDSTESSTGNSHTFPCPRKFMAEGSYSSAASVQTARTAPCGTFKRNGDFPSGRPRTAADRWHHSHPWWVARRTGCQGRHDRPLRRRLAHRRHQDQDR